MTRSYVLDSAEPDADGCAFGHLVSGWHGLRDDHEPAGGEVTHPPQLAVRVGERATRPLHGPSLQAWHDAANGESLALPFARFPSLPFTSFQGFPFVLFPYAKFACDAPPFHRIFFSVVRVEMLHGERNFFRDGYKRPARDGLEVELSPICGAVFVGSDTGSKRAL